MTTEELTREEPITEPPKRWRNWWRCYAVLARCGLCGTVVPVQSNGMWATHCRIYPSRDVAESNAMKSVGAYTEYLGAHPEGERP